MLDTLLAYCFVLIGLNCECCCLKCSLPKICESDRSFESIKRHKGTHNAKNELGEVSGICGWRDGGGGGGGGMMVSFGQVKCTSNLGECILRVTCPIARLSE